MLNCGKVLILERLGQLNMVQEIIFHRICFMCSIVNLWVIYIDIINKLMVDKEIEIWYNYLLLKS